MATPTRFPGSDTVDHSAVSVRIGVDESIVFSSIAPELIQVKNFTDLIATPALTSGLPNAIKDVRGTNQNRVLRSDGTQVASEAMQLRSCIFTNYTASNLYLHIHTVSPAPAAGAVPDYPPIVVGANQTLILDQAYLGVDGNGYNAYTVRVSTTQIGYTPTAATAGLWAALLRFKGAI